MRSEVDFLSDLSSGLSEMAARCRQKEKMGLKLWDGKAESVGDAEG